MNWAAEKDEGGREKKGRKKEGRSGRVGDDKSSWDGNGMTWREAERGNEGTRKEKKLRGYEDGRSGENGG
jgi:hypothetical protein